MSTLVDTKNNAASTDGPGSISRAIPCSWAPEMITSRVARFYQATGKQSAIWKLEELRACMIENRVVIMADWRLLMTVGQIHQLLTCHHEKLSPIHHPIVNRRTTICETISSHQKHKEV